MPSDVPATYLLDCRTVRPNFNLYVAVQDPVLDAAVRELKKAFPKVQLRKVLLSRFKLAAEISCNSCT